MVSRQVLTRKSSPPIWLLRLFASSWAGVLLLLAYGLRLSFGPPFFGVAIAVIGGGLVFGLFFPGALRRPYALVERLLQPVGTLASLILLALVYFGLFTPYALTLRLSGRDPLRRAARSRRQSGWIARPETVANDHFFWQS